MNKLVLITAFLFMIQSLSGQSGSFGDWMVRMELGVEKHDKRLFNYPAVIIRDRILREYADEQWGTYHAGVNLHRKVIASGVLSSYGGIGISYENATFRRPFDHKYFVKGNSFDILLLQNQYRKIKTPIYINSFLKLSKHLFVSTEIGFNWLVYRSITHSNSSWPSFPYSETTFELDDINLQLGIGCRIGNFNIGITSRLLNYQKIDKIIFNRILRDPRVDQIWEWYNPLQFDLTVGYTW